MHSQDAELVSNVLFIAELWAILEKKRLRGREDDRGTELRARAVAPAVVSKGNN